MIQSKSISKALIKIIQKRLWIIFIFFFFTKGSSQHYDDYSRQQNQIFAYNILSNGLIGGIGGLINKKKHEKAVPTFIKNFGKGCLGGFVKYTAKSQTYYLQYPENTFYAPINRLHFFLGHSIIMNASQNKGVFDNYYANFYGFDFKFDFKANRSERLQTRVSLASMVSLSSFIISGYSFDLYKTIEYGLFYFNTKENDQLRGIYFEGIAGVNTIGIKQNQYLIRNSIISHEIVHTYQGYDFLPLSNFYKKKYNKLTANSNWYNKVSSVVNIDYEFLFFNFLYIVNEKPIESYYKNFFEFEAEHFATRFYVPR